MSSGGSLERVGLRLRTKSKDSPPAIHKKSSSESSDDKKRAYPLSPRRRPTNLAFVLVSLSFSVLLCGASVYFTRARVSALLGRGTSPAPHDFSTPTAMEHVRALAGQPRWIGTKALDTALLHVERTARRLRKEAARHGLDLDVEVFRSGAGSYPLSIGPIGLFLSYDQLPNVVVRLAPAGHPRGQADGLLVNAHVDSAAGAPGASDNAAGAAVALDVLRALASTPAEVNGLRRPVVFLFNGGEEAGLTAAHAFVTQHKLAKDVAAHINTESLGPGADYLLFRLGPRNAWLARAYARAVKAPLASIVASELFESAIIPAETDFTVLDKPGNIPGFDFVFLDNGFVYHSTRDDIEHVDEAGVAHAGETVLALARELAGEADAIGAHLKETATVPATDAAVGWRTRLSDTLWHYADKLHLPLDRANPRAGFLSVVGRFTFVYHDYTMLLMSAACLLTSPLFWAIRFNQPKGPHPLRALRTLFVLIGAIVSSFLSVTFVATVYSEVLRAKLPWYGSISEAVLIFAPAGLFGLYWAMFILLPRKLGADRVQNVLFGLCVLYGTETAALTWFGKMSLAVPLSYFVAFHVAAVLWHKRASKAKMLLCQFVLTLPAMLWGAQLGVSGLKAFLPILARVGPKKIPIDVIVGILVVLMSLLQVVLPTLPILLQFPLSLRHLRNISLLGVAFGAMHVMRSVPAGRVPVGWGRETFSTDAPRRLFVIHFHAPQMKPPTTLGMASFDVLPIVLEPIVRKLNEADEPQLAVMDDMPRFGSLNGTQLETFQSFNILVGKWSMHQTRIQPLLPVPVAVVTKEKNTADGGFEMTIQVSAPESHVISARFPIESVKSWSFEGDVRGNHNKGKEMWVRHTGTEKWKFVLVMRKSEVSGGRDKLPIVVASIRLGFGMSTLLPELSFSESDSPMFTRGTAAEFLL